VCPHKKHKKLFGGKVSEDPRENKGVSFSKTRQQKVLTRDEARENHVWGEGDVGKERTVADPKRKTISKPKGTGFFPHKKGPTLGDSGPGKMGPAEKNAKVSIA